MKYNVFNTKRADEDFARLAKNEPKASFIQIEISGLCI